jgi:hypothetical protein
LPEAGHETSIPSVLIDHAQSVRQKRREGNLLFAAQHLNTLFDRAFDMVGSFPTTTFDYLPAARQDFPVSPSMAKYFENFVTQLPVARHLYAFAAPVLASGILFDQYPPGMHC